MGTPKAPGRVFTASAVNDRKGGLGIETLASADFEVLRVHSQSGFGRVRVKLVATMFACASPFVASSRDKRRLRSTRVTAQCRVTSVRLRYRAGLPDRQRRFESHAFGCETRDRRRGTRLDAAMVTLPRKFSAVSRRHGIRRLAAAVIL